MPPKSAGKKNLSKAEKERLKREEEERKRLEEEEQRLRDIQEAKERRKRERIEAEERKQREREELIKRSAELEQLRAVLHSFNEKLTQLKNEHRKQNRWERYMVCDASPDPSIPQEINTFINLWEEDEDRVGIDEVLKDSELCLRLLDELEYLVKDDPQSEDTPRHKKTMLALQSLLRKKMNRASHEMLCQATALADSETANLQLTWKNDRVRLCLWGNLSKNPRIKSYDFEEEGISFDIPKPLTLSDCAFRILFTNYDHNSHLANTYEARQKMPEVEEVVVEEAPPPEEEKPAEEEGAEEQPEGEQEQTNAADLLAELNRLDNEEGAAEEEAPAPEPEEVIEPPEEDLVQEPEPIEWEEVDWEEDVVDLRAYQVIGGVFDIDLLALPPQPKMARGWTMTARVNPPKLRPLDYEVDLPPGMVSKSATVVEEQPEGEEAAPPAEAEAETPQPTPAAPALQPAGLNAAAGAPAQEKKEEKPPITITLKLQAGVNLAETPQIAHWDPNILEWRTGGMEVVSMNEEERHIVFRTAVFGTMALLQDFHINMPFQSWELRPYVGGYKPSTGDDEVAEPTATENTEDPEVPPTTNHCLLTIVAAIHEIKLQVCEDRVAVVPDPEKTELNHLEGQWFTVDQIVTALRESGVNVFPREDSQKFVTVADKNAIAEDRLYEQMALLSPSVAFASSRLNAHFEDKERFLMQACEILQNKPVDEGAWNLFTGSRYKIQKLKMGAFDETFSEELDEAMTFHADFYHMYEEFASQEGLERVRNVDHRYFDTIRQLLKACRILVYS